MAIPSQVNTSANSNVWVTHTIGISKTCEPGVLHCFNHPPTHLPPISHPSIHPSNYLQPTYPPQNPPIHPLSPNHSSTLATHQTTHPIHVIVLPINHPLINHPPISHHLFIHQTTFNPSIHPPTNPSFLSPTLASTLWSHLYGYESNYMYNNRSIHSKVHQCCLWQRLWFWECFLINIVIGWLLFIVLHHLMRLLL